MAKTSLEYAELTGLRIFIEKYKTAYEIQYGKHKDYDVNKPVGPQAIMSCIQDRIRELEKK
jgi:hypothetical protein